VRHEEATAEFMLMLSDIDGANEEVLAVRKDGARLSKDGPAWSPDGSMIVCPATHWDKGFHTKLIGFDVKNRSEQLIGDQSWFSIFQVAWQEDMSSLVISARDRGTSPYQLWRIGFPDGLAQRITSNLDNYDGVSLAGDKIVTIRKNITWWIWVVTLDEPQKASEIFSGSGVNYGLNWSSEGKIVFSSMVQDNLHISRIDADGSNRVQLTSAGDNYTPAFSADGRYIVFSSDRNGPFNIWRINTDDGSDAKQLTFGDGNYYPSTSPDNQWVAFDNVVSSHVSVWKVPLHGGDAIKVGERYRMPVFSPDNQFIAARYNLDSGSRDGAIFSAQGGQPLKYFPVPIQEWQRLQWLNDHEVSYIKNTNGYSNIWSYDFNTEAAKQLTNFNSNRIYAYAWSPDFKQVVCQRVADIRDVTMISER
jgi:Tol biopolymer transport system component